MENHYFSMGKSTISMAIFNSYVSVPEGSRERPEFNDIRMIFNSLSRTSYQGDSL